MIKLFSKYIRKDDGATAIEFAGLAVPYFLLTMGILELSLVFTAESLLEGATTHASREIRTGSIQSSGSADMEQLFRDELCGYATVLIQCNDIDIEVQTLTDFASFSGLQPQFDDDGNFVSRGFVPGGSSEKVLIRTVYQYSSFTPLVGPLIYGANNQKTFISTTVMQVEPYDFAAEVAANGGG